ncbi:3-deoxy-manno-octulosonate cytidylyltransferase [Sphingomonas sp. H39-1-10]|uniref:3-deoxy-manno-octulosonate cytidylyltransferase n=1 Tax=Sphingomonas pollutisoli TaxID=3030829 RepID=UPI0023B9C730|nr:3-deoxy-manno-octulosonate cytidylyltransferase [Sphingomonas pollutisoli]MDF0490365.1 3-deoxy-manno-octulosonate cytidylyltransferase [Sphingomonas pollutisoli]
MTLSLVGGTDLASRTDGVVIIVPARLDSSRFPGKPLAPLRGADGTPKSLVQRSWEAARAVAPAVPVVIATDDEGIADAAAAFGATAVLTSPGCRNGTERCWEAVQAAGIDADIIVNLQGDAPLTPPLAVEALIDTLRADPRLAVATPMIRCPALMLDRLLCDARSGRVGGTTVVFDRLMNALYFSKRVIPYVPERTADAPVHLHIGLYAYRRDVLGHYAELPPSPLELVEGLEQLRFLDAGIPMRMVEVADPPGGLWEVNNPEDIVTVETALAARRID